MSLSVFNSSLSFVAISSRLVAQFQGHVACQNFTQASLTLIHVVIIHCIIIICCS